MHMMFSSGVAAVMAWKKAPIVATSMLLSCFPVLIAGKHSIKHGLHQHSMGDTVQLVKLQNKCLLSQHEHGEFVHCLLYFGQHHIHEKQIIMRHMQQQHQ
ncbi:hypothetical protein ABBQ32_008802 [Trebouxia sp. C0010 RCD-2024]